jgi:hypothetical protein
MVNIEQVKQGFARYVDAEFTNKMTGINRWLVGGIAGIAILRAENIYNHLKDMPFIKMLDVVDENGMIDIDIIYNAFLDQARRGEAVIDMPMVGQTKFNEHDIEMLYRYIVGG